MKLITKAFFVLLIFFNAFNSVSAQSARPKLVVGIVIDQMRWDYLYRYADRYGTGGFKRLLNEGFSCENTFIPYTPTVTAVGHTCAYTGSVPALHGIISNSWYNKAERRFVYCAEDNSVQTVGSTSAAGKMSPRNLWSTTISDELRLAQNFRNKTIGIAIKDRGAILPAGHSANAAYWFDASVGGFITSTYYMQALPQWVAAFNAKRLPDAYLKQNWNTQYPLNTYIQSTTDNEDYENRLLGGSNTFPYKSDTLTVNKYESFKYLPAANTYTFDMAKAAIEGESLGKRGVTDMLAISCSSTDYVGHAMGPNSIEAEDMYLRLDKDLAQFLAYLDGTVGKGQYVIFLTADHGAAHVPRFLQEHRIPGGVIDAVSLQARLNAGLQKSLGISNLIEAVINNQVYLNDTLLEQKALQKNILKQQIIDSLLQVPGIANAVDLEKVQEAPVPEFVKNMLVNGYNQKLSGDIQFIYKPQWFEGNDRGTTHDAWNPYDSHIPLLWFGWGIKSGHTNRNVYMSDIAPTLAALLHVQMPNACIGTVIQELAK